MNRGTVVKVPASVTKQREPPCRALVPRCCLYNIPTFIETDSQGAWFCHKTLLALGDGNAGLRLNWSVRTCTLRWPDSGANHCDFQPKVVEPRRYCEGVGLYHKREALCRCIGTWCQPLSQNVVGIWRRWRISVISGFDGISWIGGINCFSEIDGISGVRGIGFVNGISAVSAVSVVAAAAKAASVAWAVSVSWSVSVAWAVSVWSQDQRD